MYETEEQQAEMNTFSGETSRPPQTDCAQCPYRLLCELLGEGLAVRLSGVSVLLPLSGLLDPADQTGVTLSVLLQH